MWNLKAFCHTGILPALYGKEVVGSSLTENSDKRMYRKLLGVLSIAFSSH